MHTQPHWFQEKFQVGKLEICTFEHWIWSLRPSQPTLGASILSLNREVAAWGRVTASECAELSAITAKIEKALQSAFSFEKINYLMLMMVDPHVHFHILPRYENEREFKNRLWTDETWPKLPDLNSKTEDDATLSNILMHIKRFL